MDFEVGGKLSVDILQQNLGHIESRPNSLCSRFQLFYYDDVTSELIVAPLDMKSTSSSLERRYRLLHLTFYVRGGVQ